MSPNKKGKAPHKPRYVAVNARPNWMPPGPLPRNYWEGWHWNNGEWWWHTPRADWEQPLPPISYTDVARMTEPPAQASSSSSAPLAPSPPPPPPQSQTPPPPPSPDALNDFAWDLTQSLNDTTPKPAPAPARPTFQLAFRAGPPTESLSASQTTGGKRKRDEDDEDEGREKGKGKGKEREK